MPTLEVNDQVLTLAAGTAGLRRGDVLVVQSGDERRVSRLVGLGGDVIAMREGLVLINGRVAEQRRLGVGPREEDGSSTSVVAERFPDENNWHRLLDYGPAPQDDMAPTSVPRGSLFLLSDNRDRAADSRFSDAEAGIGMVRVKDVIGIVDTVMWSKDSARIGRPIDQAPPYRTHAK